MNPRKLYQWVSEVSKSWTGFSRHFRENVAIFSRGVAQSQSSQLRKIAGCVPGQVESQRRRLQRFVKQEISMSQFFTAWTQSMVKTLGCNALVLVVDETKLKGKFGVMVVGAVFEGRCIPLAWRVYQANSQSDYPPEGQVKMILKLLAPIQSGVPERCAVRVLADRGIGTSPDLMRGIEALGWTFLFRVTRQSKIVLPDGQAVRFYDQVSAPGDCYCAGGRVFKKRGHIPGYVRVLWGTHAQERWALVTNDPHLTGWEYAQRMWIEEAFRDLKSHGWHIEQACFTCPERMARLWILLVVAYTWLLLWGHAIVVAQQGLAPKRRSNGSYVRRWSVFREGWLAFQRYTLQRTA
jgi:hypothetical protein